MSDTTKHMQTIYDQAFKRLLRRKEVLACVVCRYVKEFRGMRPQEVVPYLEDPRKGMVLGLMDRESDDESGVVRYDTLVMVRSRLREGKVAAVVNIEGQNDPYPWERTGRRVQYTAARLVSGQKGVFFEGDAYGGMVDVCKSQRKKARESQRKRERRSQRKGRETDKQSGTQESHSASC